MFSLWYLFTRLQSMIWISFESTSWGIPLFPSRSLCLFFSPHSWYQYYSEHRTIASWISGELQNFSDWTSWRYLTKETRIIQLSSLEETRRWEVCLLFSDIYAEFAGLSTVDCLDQWDTSSRVQVSTISPIEPSFFPSVEAFSYFPNQVHWQ